MTAAVAKRPGLQSTASQDPLERPSALATEACRGVRRLVMVQSPLAFDFSKTRTICDAFDGAWAFLQGDRREFAGNFPSSAGKAAGNVMRFWRSDDQRIQWLAAKCGDYLVDANARFAAIPALRDDPKLVGRDDTKV